MTVDEAIKAYRTMSAKVFSETKILGDGKFKATNLEDAIREILAEQTGNPKEMMLPSDDAIRPKWYVNEALVQ